VSSPDFGYERARRFRRALDAYPRARTTELLPLLAACLPRGSGADVAVELGAGSGYLTRLLQEMYDTVYAVEKSEQMLRQLAGGGAIPLRVDGLEHGAGSLPPHIAVDLVVSLATFHHIVVRDPGTGVVQPELSRRRQADAITAWADRLTDGGRFVFVDVGRPSGASSDYLQAAAQTLDSVPTSAAPPAEIARLDEALPYAFRETLDVIGYPADAAVSLPELARAYAAGDFPLTAQGPIGHFDVTVAEHSIEGHDAYFWSEEDLRAAMTAAGLSDVVVLALPTPWLFLDSLGAHWFVNELFGLDLDSKGATETGGGIGIIDRNLTIRSREGHAVVDWQLLYATGVQRGRGGAGLAGEGAVP
jgi:SAM-dependent methyltransferase